MENNTTDMMREHFELVHEYRNDADCGDNKEVYDIRFGWNKAKEAGELAGCGLIGRMTMDEIDDMDEKITKVIREWVRLAGISAPRLNYYELVVENALLKKQVQALEKQAKQPDGK